MGGRRREGGVEQSGWGWGIEGGVEQSRQVASPHHQDRWPECMVWCEL